MMFLLYEGKITNGKLDSDIRIFSSEEHLLAEVEDWYVEEEYTLIAQTGAEARLKRDGNRIFVHISDQSGANDSFLRRASFQLIKCAADGVRGRKKIDLSERIEEFNGLDSTTLMVIALLVELSAA